MSGAQTSTFADPNILLRTLSGDQTAQVQRNQLLNQGAQQALNENEMEQISRASNWVISQDPETRPASGGIQTAVRLLQANSYAKKAPEQYPGFDSMQMMARQGTPSKDLYQQTQDSAWANANKIGGGGAPGATAPPADGGGGFSSDKETARKQIVARESGGNPTVLNYVAQQDPTAYARGATASGKYQFVNSTWREGLQLAGLDPAKYATARDAPEAVQDQVFDAVYAKYGTKPWQQGPKDWVKDEAGNYQLATVRPPPGSPGGAPVTAAAAPPGGGVVARNPGAVQVAGPGAGPPAAPAAPAATPDLMGPRPLPPIGPQSPVVTPESLANTPAPQNALAPPPPPAAPAVAPAATPPPAATAPPPPPAAPQQPPFSRPAPVNPATGLRSDQEQELNGLLPMASRSREGQAQWVARKQQMIQQNQADQRQYETQVNTWQNQQGEAADRAERLRLSQEADKRAADKAKQEADEKNQPLQGNDIDVQHERLLNNLAPKIRNGTATEAEKALYSGSYYALQQKGGQPVTITDPSDPSRTIPATITRRLAPELPEPPGGALPLVMAQPGAGKQEQMNDAQATSANYADRMVTANRVMNKLDSDATTWAQKVRESAGNFIGYNINSRNINGYDRRKRTSSSAFYARKAVRRSAKLSGIAMRSSISRCQATTGRR